MDTIEKIEGALIQHGPHNDRVYIMQVPEGNAAGAPALLETVHRLARKRGYGKVFARIPETWWPAFREAGYGQEALVPGFFSAGAACVFAGRFFDPQRATVQEGRRLHDVLEACRDLSSGETGDPHLSMEEHACTPGDAEEMAALFRSVFATYPFPIHEPAFLRHIMAEGSRFLGVRRDGRLAALASLEPDKGAPAAEMGDFATLPACRGMGLARHLLQLLDRMAAEAGLATTFTIARACSFGMNRAFARCGYRYAGRLVNNTQIAGSIQSMNVWYKKAPLPGGDP
jgi:putative beta-lysine N-acetyltransferase